MREFPVKFVPENVKLFAQYQFDRDVCYLREEIYEFYLGEGVKEEKTRFEEPFDLSAFKKKRRSPNFSKMVEMVCKELEALEKGKWKTKVGYGGDALWVYPKASPPKALPDW